MNTQSVTSVARQVLAIISVAMGVVTASVTSLHLPTAVSSILVVVGGVLLAIEHYVADPSTGTAVVGQVPPIAATPCPPVPPAPPVA